MSHPTVYAALTIVTVPAAPTSAPWHTQPHRIAGVGIFVARCDGRRGWRFASHSRTVTGVMTERGLLRWLDHWLPPDAILIGWEVDHILIPRLLQAASIMGNVVFERFVAKLMRLQRGAVDIANMRPSIGAVCLAEVAEDMAIYAPQVSDVGRTPSTQRYNAVDLRHDLADEALGLWRVFLRSAGSPGFDAEDATNTWAMTIKGRPSAIRPAE